MINFTLLDNEDLSALNTKTLKQLETYVASKKDMLSSAGMLDDAISATLDEMMTLKKEMAGKSADKSKSVYLFLQATKFIDDKLAKYSDLAEKYRKDITAMREKYKGLWIQTQEMRAEAEGIRSHYPKAIVRLVDKFISPIDTIKIILNNFISTLYYTIDNANISYDEATQMINYELVNFDLEDHLL